MNNGLKMIKNGNVGGLVYVINRDRLINSMAKNGYRCVLLAPASGLNDGEVIYMEFEKY